MLDRVSSQELTEWIAFSQLEPFGGDVDYLGSAIVAATVANTRLNKGQKPYPVSEFIPKFERKVQTVDSMLQVAQMMTVAMGGQDLREDTNGE